MPLPRKTRGRQRVEMKRMDKKSNRQVTFSKRRAGLFKKASELCTLCGAKVAVIVFSPGKKVFSFGHPSVEYVLERFLGGGGPQGDSSGMVRLLEAHRDHSIQELNDKVTHASLRVEMVKRRGEELERLRRANEAECWWESPMEELSGSQLGELTAALLHLRDRLCHNIALTITKEDMIKRNNSALLNLHRPTYNNLNFGPYGGGGILVPIPPYNVSPPPVVTNGDGYYNPGQVLEYEDGHVVGGFRNLLLGNDDYGLPASMELPGQGWNFAGAPQYVYQNQFGYGFF